MTAVKNGDIRPIDDSTVTRPGPRLMLGLPLARQDDPSRRARAVAFSDSTWGSDGRWPPAAARSSPPDSTSGGPGVSAAGRSCWRWSGSSRSWARCILGVGLGTVAIAPGDTLAIIAHRLLGLDLGATWTPATEAIVWDLRLPRVLTAMVVGHGAGGRGRDVPGPAPQPAR